MSLHAIEPTRSRGQRRVDGVELHAIEQTQLRRQHRVDTGGDDRLDYQLTAQFKLWLRDETKGLTIDESKKPMLSRIFLWYAGDFETRGGSPAYAAQYAPAGAARDALATTAPDYFAYDWNLNTQ